MTPLNAASTFLVRPRPVEMPIQLIQAKTDQADEDVPAKQIEKDAKEQYDQTANDELFELWI